MPVPTDISQLSTTPGSNSPSGSDSPSVLDDHQRTTYAFIRTLSDTKAASADAVLLTGAQTAAGVKTFSNGIVANVTGNVTGTAANVTGTVAVANGGTGSTTAANARTALGVDGTNFVTMTGDQTIAGVKTFSTAPVMTAGAVVGNGTMAPLGNAPLYPVRAWCSFNGTTGGTNPPTVGGNVSTVQRVSPGLYTISFSTALNTAGYAVSAVAYNNVSATTQVNVGGSAPTINSFTIACVNAGGTAIDPQFVTVMVVC